MGVHGWGCRDGGAWMAALLPWRMLMVLVRPARWTSSWTPEAPVGGHQAARGCSKTTVRVLIMRDQGPMNENDERRRRVYSWRHLASPSYTRRKFACPEGTTLPKIAHLDPARSPPRNGNVLGRALPHERVNQPENRLNNMTSSSIHINYSFLHTQSFSEGASLAG